MKKALWTDLLREIRRSLSRFLSILFISSLGVAFFCGVRSSEPDMHLSADALYDDTSFMDIRIISTMGLTDQDTAAIKNVSGIASAEGYRQGEALTATSDHEYVISLMSLTRQVAVPKLLEGRLPENSQECLIDELLKDSWQIGDTITFYGGDTDEILKEKTYTITGYAYSPFYLNWDRGTAGIGNGNVNAFVILPEDAFSIDYYHMILVRADGAENLTCMTDEYDQYVADVMTNIEKISGKQNEKRYNQIYYQAVDSIEDGRAQLEAAEKTLNEKLAEAKTTLENGAARLENGRKELAEKQETYNSGLNQYQEALQTLNDSKAVLAQGKTDLQQGKTALSQAEDELTKARLTLIDKKIELSAGWSEYNSGLSQYESLNQIIASLEIYIKELEDQLIEQGIDPENSNAYVHLKEALEEARSNLDEKKELLETARKELEDGERALLLAQNQIADGETQIAIKKNALDESEAALLKAEMDISSGETQLAEQKTKLDSGAAQLRDAENTLAASEQELADGWTAYYTEKEDAEKQLEDSKQQIKDSELLLRELETPDWYILDRNSIQTYVEYQMDSQRIGAIGRVFPAIFFLVAALVSLTTMTRMVEEQRTQIGTLKALGYNTSSIAAKYLIYAFTATLSGSLLGILVGSKVLPYVIQAAYGILYVGIPHYMLPLQPGLCLLSIAMALGCTVLAALAACIHALKDTPAALMRPAAPTSGKRILLERFSFIWNHLSFSWKSSMRNLFRYKKRLAMTIFGIGGCMGLLMVGYGLQDSIAKIVDNQYQTICTYDASIAVNSECDLDVLKDTLNQSAEIESYLPVYTVSKDIRNKDSVESAYLFIPEDTDSLDSFINLHTESGTPLDLTDEGVIITGKLARLLNADVGDTISIADGPAGSTAVTIIGIAENYLYHYVYMTPEFYRTTFTREPCFTNVLFHLYTASEESENLLARQLLEEPEILSYASTRDLQDKVAQMMDSLNLVIIVLIVSAGLLAFVVLYNLNNINITERRRELATLRVLGFYDHEMAAYIYRENIVLTILGIFVGMFIGYGLHKYVISTVEIDMLMFGQHIRPRSYLYSILLTLLFSSVVNVVMFFKLRKIDMIESLKSVE